MNRFRYFLVYSFLLWSTGMSAAAQPWIQQPASARYDVVVLRVEFQPDTSRFTTGDGTFNDRLFGGLVPKVDPFPHDQAYFEAHLEFLTDYVARVSDGRTTLRTYVVPEVIRVSGKMGSYSPTGRQASSPTEQKKLASLIQESWTLADQISSFSSAGLDPDRTVFLLFHAGTGRDIELLGTVLNKTPEDLPSIFFGETALSQLISEPVSFKGIPVTHTAVLPETESRVGYNFFTRENFLLELSINGLLAASFLNYLGAPDLFNSDTGETAIGGFGVMDAEGIFAYSGLFPPEPSAWTKLFLGWTDPLVITRPSTGISISAGSLAGNSDVVVVPISGSEYFLIENRFRDPEGDGLTVRTRQDGTTTEFRESGWNPDFTRENTEAFPGGVVTGVDNYDWALPGGIDCNETETFGGILIWHIDEARLQRLLPVNRVNADPRARSIDLEEADSGQDIGFENSSGRGTQYDYYYEGNPPECFVDENGRPVGRYENRFGPNTLTPSNNNAGGFTGIVIENFSAPGAVMTFDVDFVAANGIGRSTGYENLILDGMPSAEGSVKTVSVQNGSVSVVYSGTDEDNLLILQEQDSIVSAFDIEGGSLTTPVLRAEPAGSATVFVLQNSDAGLVLREVDLETRQSNEYPLPAVLASALPVSALVEVGGVLYTAWRSGSQSWVARFEQSWSVEAESDGRILGLAAAPNDDLAIISTNGVRLRSGARSWLLSLGPDDTVSSGVFGTDRTGTTGVIAVNSAKELYWLLADGTVQGVNLSRYAETVDTHVGNPVLAELDSDGRLDAVVSVGDRLLAFGQGGALVGLFPISFSSPITTQPLVTKSVDSESVVFIIGTAAGDIQAKQLSARTLSVAGFPLSAGYSTSLTPSMSAGRLVAVGDDGRIFVWDTPFSDTAWGQRFGGPGNNVVVAATTGPNQSSESVFETREVYNWPNPVLGGTTFIRFATTLDAQVTISILDLAGAGVADLDPISSPAGVPVEVPWLADVSSGIYFARISATAADGATETRMVKMAVIR